MISSQYARLLTRELDNLGISGRDYLKNTGLGPNSVWLETELGLASFLQLLRNARRLMGEDALTQALAKHHRIASLGMMGTAMMAAPRVRDGLQAMASFSVVHAGYIRFKVQAGARQTRIVLQFDEPLDDCLDLHVEALFALLMDYFADMLGYKPQDMAFEIAYPAAEKHARYMQFFGEQLRFEQASNAILFPSDWLNLRSPYGNPEIWALARRYLSDQLAQSPDHASNPFTGHLRATLLATQPPFPDIADVAQDLHLSVRTLNRRLQEENSSFRQLKNEATHEWAQRQLTEGTTVEAIALELGYDNPANFRRAFREHTGHSPSEWLRSN